MKEEKCTERNAGTAGGIGAVLLAMLGGAGRYADDVGRGMLRYADDVGRAGIQRMDDVGRSRFLQQTDEVTNSVRNGADDLFHASDEFGGRWPEIERVMGGHTARAVERAQTPLSSSNADCVNRRLHFEAAKIGLRYAARAQQDRNQRKEE